MKKTLKQKQQVPPSPKPLPKPQEKLAPPPPPPKPQPKKKVKKMSNEHQVAPEAHSEIASDIPAQQHQEQHQEGQTQEQTQTGQSQGDAPKLAGEEMEIKDQKDQPEREEEQVDLPENLKAEGHKPGGKIVEHKIEPSPLPEWVKEQKSEEHAH